MDTTRSHLLWYKAVNVPIRYHITGRRASEIAESIERGIREGDLTAGTRLPTVRSLASHRGISTATVASAYRELRRRGLVAGAGRLGTSIAPRVPPAPRGRPIVPRGRSRPPHRQPRSGAAARPAARARLAAAASRCSTARPGSDPELLALDGRAPGARRGPERSPRRSSVARSTACSSRSWRTSRPGIGSRSRIPCYPGIIDLASALGLAVLPMAIDDRGPTPEGLARALRAGAAACALTPRAQNPYGSAVDAERAAELGRCSPAIRVCS